MTMTDEYGEPIECLDGMEGGCEGDVEYHINPYGDSMNAWPRCSKHFDLYVDRMQDLAQRYPVNPPSDFDPSYAGESWNDDY